MHRKSEIGLLVPFAQMKVILPVWWTTKGNKATPRGRWLVTRGGRAPSGGPHCFSLRWRAMQKQVPSLAASAPEMGYQAPWLAGGTPTKFRFLG